MDDTIHYLPLFCQQLMRSQVSPLHVRRWLTRARADWKVRQETERACHRRWDNQPLTRAETLLKREALVYAREYASCLEHALGHLTQYAHGAPLREVYRAAAWCTRGERARENYLKRRALLERTALEWRPAKAA